MPHRIGTGWIDLGVDSSSMVNGLSETRRRWRRPARQHEGDGATLHMQVQQRRARSDALPTGGTFQEISASLLLSSRESQSSLKFKTPHVPRFTATSMAEHALSGLALAPSHQDKGPVLGYGNTPVETMGPLVKRIGKTTGLRLI